jgi:hypothetical protein
MAIIFYYIKIYMKIERPSYGLDGNLIAGNKVSFLPSELVDVARYGQGFSGSKGDIGALALDMMCQTIAGECADTRHNISESLANSSAQVVRSALQQITVEARLAFKDRLVVQELALAVTVFPFTPTVIKEHSSKTSAPLYELPLSDTAGPLCAMFMAKAEDLELDAYHRSNPEIWPDLQNTSLASAHALETDFKQKIRIELRKARLLQPFITSDTWDELLILPPDL